MATLVFHHNGIGDYVMTLPALRLLAAAAPAPLDIVFGDCAAAWLYDEIPVRHRIAVSVWPGEFAHEIALPQALPDHGYDVFISLATWQSEQLVRLADMSDAAVRLGFFSNATLRPDPAPRHDFDRLFSLAAPFRRGARTEDYAECPALPKVTRCERRRLVIHADTRREKMWPLECYDPLIQRFAERFADIDVVLLNAADEALPTARCNVNVSIARVDLREAMALTAEADYFFGVDSCMLHVADLCRTPGLALFGPTAPDQFGFRFSPGGRHLYAPAGLGALSVDEVFAELVSVVEVGS